MINLYKSHWSPRFRLRQNKTNARIYNFSIIEHLTTIMAIMSHPLESELILITEKFGPNRKYPKPEIMKILFAIAFIANSSIL
jgi:hypothetical protein